MIMNLEDAKKIALDLTRSHGLGLLVEYKTSEAGPIIILRPEDLPSIDSFTVNILVGWKKLSIEFKPANLARPLIEEMGNASADSKSVYKSLALSLEDRGAILRMNINGVAAAPEKPENWPDKWENLTISLQTPFIEADEDLAKDAKSVGEVLKWAGLFLTLLICLLPVEEEDEINLPEGKPEGELSRTEINKYERSRANRLVCIAIRGTTCLVCGFNFLNAFGLTGDGVIVVHHIVPVSKIGKDYVIDPAKDLIPVCANCHLMIHYKDPPYTIDEVRTLLNSSKN
jgi:5-methylcytosine-specific restriction enzyme A